MDSAVADSDTGYMAKRRHTGPEGVWVDLNIGSHRGYLQGYRTRFFFQVHYQFSVTTWQFRQ